jgi:hypothetical protein
VSVPLSLRFSLSTSVPPHAGVNTRPRAEVTADPGIHEPTLSVVGRHRHVHRMPTYKLPNGDAFKMEADPYGGRHSFIMHASCCSLLAQFFHPKPIPVARLVEACRTCLVLRGDYLGWGPGHDYGGIIKLRNRFPWDEPDDYENDTARDPEDPWSIPELTRHLKRATQSIEKRSRQARGSMREPHKRPSERLTTVGHIVSNYFTKLPLEILESILAFAPTDGVKSLAQTSKGLNIIIPSRLGQYFWASRFQDPFECGFVFEAQTYGLRLDWKSLYFSITNDPSPRLQNRRRIWGLIQQLSELICVQWKGGQGLLPLGRDENKLKWKEVHGLIQEPERGPHRRIGISQGCLRLYSQYTSIPTLLCRIVVSTVSIGTATYVTGLRFISNQETEICLGYTNGRELSLETTGLQGFIIAVGSRGIHAIQFVTPTRQLSQWFGNPKGVPITRRLVSYKPITALKAGFDVRPTAFYIIYLLIIVY